jgi:hypothetical protein
MDVHSGTLPLMQILAKSLSSGIRAELHFDLIRLIHWNISASFFCIGRRKGAQ